MDPFNTIEKRVSDLGNHLHKFTYTIKRHKDNLIADLDRSGKLMQIHLWHSSFSTPDEMAEITCLTDDQKRNVENLSCYYSLQYLHMIFRNVDILALGIVSGGSQTEVYHQFLMQFGDDYRQLSQAYLQNLLNIYLADHKSPEFFNWRVGTRTDQDCNELGIHTS